MNKEGPQYYSVEALVRGEQTDISSYKSVTQSMSVAVECLHGVVCQLME
jgi:hypothetical protein